MVFSTASIDTVCHSESIRVWRVQLCTGSGHMFTQMASPTFILEIEAHGLEPGDNIPVWRLQALDIIASERDNRYHPYALKPTRF